MLNLLYSVDAGQQNKNKNEFPDFIDSSGYGIIEHFRVTSGEEKKKGSINIQNQNKSYNNFKNKIKNSAPFTFVHEEFERKSDSLGNFNKSFKKQFNSHIESYNKFLKTYNKPLCCFLIDSDDNLIGHIKYKDKNNWNKYINPCRERILNVFLYNEEILKFIYENKNYVDYIIFFNHNWGYIEYLRVVDIPKILEKIDQSIYECDVTAVAYSICSYNNYYK